MSDSTALEKVASAEVDRATFIGGSDIAAILRISPWVTPVQLYYRKTEPAEVDPSGRKVKKRGHLWESVVAEMLTQELVDKGHQVEVVATNRRFRDDVEPFACEIDYEIKLDGSDDITNVELKTVHPNAASHWGESETDDCPVWYTTQAMWGLGITGRKQCIVAPLFGADELRVYMVERDENLIAWMRAEAHKFWHDHVVPRVPPAPMTSADLAKLYPRENAGAIVYADESLTAAVLELREISAGIDALNARWDSLEYKVKLALGPAEILSLGDQPAVTWTERPSVILDQQRLKAEHPKLVKEFTKRSSSRVFLLKKFKWGSK